MSNSVTRRDFVGAVAPQEPCRWRKPWRSPPLLPEAAAWPKLRPATIYKLYIGRSGATTNADRQKRPIPDLGQGGSHQDGQPPPGPREEARRRDVRRRRDHPAGGRGAGGRQGRVGRRPAADLALRPWRRLRHAGEAQLRSGQAGGLLLSAVQRARVDVAPAMEEQESPAALHYRLERTRRSRQPAAGAGLDEADAHPGRERPARHQGSLFGRGGQEEARRRRGDDQERAKFWKSPSRSIPRPPKPRRSSTGSSRPSEFSSPRARRLSIRPGTTWRSSS